MRILIGMLFAFILALNGTCAASADAWYQKGNEYCDRQEYQKAIDCFSSGIAEIEPGYSGYGLFASRGSAYNNLGQYDKGIADATTAIKRAPNEAYPYYVRAYAYLKSSMFDQAVADATRAIELYNKLPDSNWKKRSLGYAYREKGRAHYALKQYELAIADLQNARQNYPQSSYTYYMLGLVNEELGHADEAIYYYQECIGRSKPESSEYKDATACVARLKAKVTK